MFSLRGYDAAAIALAFNSVNERKTWSCRTNTRDASGAGTVHFTHNTGMVALIYHCATDKMQIRFNKYQASWGDYIKAAARAFHVVTTTLAQGGLPIEPPADYTDVEITVQPSNSDHTYISYPQPANPVMPEVRGADPLITRLAAEMQGAPGDGIPLMEDMEDMGADPTDENNFEKSASE